MESTTALPIIWKDTLIPIPENVHQQQHLVRIDDDISKEVVSSSSFENIYFPKNKSGITPKDTKESLMSTRKRKQTVKTSKHLKREMKLSKKKSHILFRNAIFGLLSAYGFLALSNRQLQGICEASIPTNATPLYLTESELQVLKQTIEEDLEIEVFFKEDEVFVDIKREDEKGMTFDHLSLVREGKIVEAEERAQLDLFGKLEKKIREKYKEEAPFWYLFEQWSSGYGKNFWSRASASVSGQKAPDSSETWRMLSNLSLAEAQPSSQSCASSNSLEEENNSIVQKAFNEKEGLAVSDICFHEATDALKLVLNDGAVVTVVENGQVKTRFDEHVKVKWQKLYEAAASFEKLNEENRSGKLGEYFTIWEKAIYETFC